MEKGKVDLIGAVVVIIKTDGYKKVGRLLSIKDELAVIEHRSGIVQAIPFAQISSIKVDAGVGDGGR
ncbi:hypothetical protein M1589_04780 [Candidatus Marsarchaeota archaeon]|jgi:hypothetical protein|nr:hypothetical protein [Candidatus Marsarchaeota archaeon]MCL5115426.1 hypothetical protein [Candidatus Marsarchaeota archaeon]